MEKVSGEEEEAQRLAQKSKSRQASEREEETTESITRAPQLAPFIHLKLERRADTGSCISVLLLLLALELLAASVEKWKVHAKSKRAIHLPERREKRNIYNCSRQTNANKPASER